MLIATNILNLSRLLLLPICHLTLTLLINVFYINLLDCYQHTVHIGKVILPHVHVCLFLNLEKENLKIT